MHTHVELIRRGYAWVGVSAQAVGVNGLKGAPPQGDPVRYAPLAHPGDSYSYDMFSQAGQAIRDDADQILGGLRPRRLLAAGESQSAGRLVTYIDAVHPQADVYDGFLVRRTIFRHVPTKEAILLDHLSIRREVTLQRLRERPVTEPLLVSLQTVFRDLAEQGYDRGC